MLEKKLNCGTLSGRVVMAVNGESLKGLRVLDVGCNEGFWSLEAHKSGAAYVLGVDARAQHVEQAQLVRDAIRRIWNTGKWTLTISRGSN